MADPLNLVGKTFAGYAVEKKIGAGGMGVVFRAFDERLRRVVALKILPPNLATDRETRERFIREGRTAAKIDHANAVRLLAAGEENGLGYLVMEYVDGGSLQARIDRFKKLSAAEVIAVGRQVALALGAGHKLGILHRDVKPANVLFTKDGEAKLADYGLAKEEKAEYSLSMTGMVMGTPHYMAPEVCEGKKADARSDLYALGVMMYYMAAGKYPFDADAVMQVLMAHVQDIAPPLENAPPALAEVIDCLMAKDPAARFQTTTELITALDEAAKDPLAAPVASRMSAMAKPPSASGVTSPKASGVRPPSASAPGGVPAGQASGIRPPSAAGNTVPVSMGPVSMAAPLPTPQWHFAAYAVAGLAFLVSAALLVWVFTRDKGNASQNIQNTGKGPGGTGKVEQNVDPATLARGELMKKWISFQGRARQEGADLEECLKQIEEFVPLDAAAVEKVRAELMGRLKDQLLAKIQSRNDHLVAEAAKGNSSVLTEASGRTKWPEVPFAKELAAAEDAVEIRAWGAYFDWVAKDVASTALARGEFGLAIDRWEHLSPPKHIGRDRIEQEQRQVWKSAKTAADRAADEAPPGEAGAKALTDLAKRMPSDLKLMLERRAYDLRQAESTGDPLESLLGFLQARDFDGVLKQLKLLEESGKVKDKAVLDRSRRLAESGKRVLHKAMEAWRGQLSKPVKLARADGTPEEGTLFEVADNGAQITLDTSHGQDVLRLADISARSLAAAALGTAPSNSDLQDALDFTVAVREPPAAGEMYRRLARRGVAIEEWEGRMVGDLFPRDLVKDAEARLRALRDMTPGPDAADAARIFLEKTRDWPLKIEERVFVERLLAASAAKWSPADLVLTAHGAVENAPDGTSRVTWSDDALLEDALPMGGIEVTGGGEGFTVAPKDDKALLMLPLWKWKDVKIHLEAKSTEKFYVLVPGSRSLSEGLPAVLGLQDQLDQSWVVTPNVEVPSMVPTRADGWYSIDVSVTGTQYVLTVNDKSQFKATLPTTWDGGVAIFLLAPLTIRTMSISGKPSWSAEDIEGEAKELTDELAKNAETAVPVGTWSKPASKDASLTITNEAGETMLKPTQWTYGSDYIVRFNATITGKGTTERWPELILDFRSGGKAQRRFYLSGKSRAGFLFAGQWMCAGFCKDVSPRESHDVALIVKGDMALLAVDGQMAWMGHAGPATTGGAAIGVHFGNLEISDLKVRALGK